ncbi:uncharacterized protein MONOS_7925 [Monocercomonoides exilis]|uniref:uncharacterized protein n=1 Tax=Monocercomonoides exilis TaxID=2049356 RepID=UPI00355A27A2|nr:hypothetical protein MONOS_7925 [Monocercomonoides exilis]|eukprot:MONOS_7925.1-p1 / transcript=MONOS_7925.1 / gene=MONOS_7925 / organism=Monocercomonoides_exilis_PA203 / gene_product=unspecified product / transcript_product=unspecified product / location=Mono_scaffold00285:37797-40282(+) / protein_length=769 / sequence_SO=supercontig / SO=protein_coding / is_pseudo=false
MSKIKNGYNFYKEDYQLNKHENMSDLKEKQNFGYFKPKTFPSSDADERNGTKNAKLNEIKENHEKQMKETQDIKTAELLQKLGEINEENETFVKKIKQSLGQSDTHAYTKQSSLHHEWNSKVYKNARDQVVSQIDSYPGFASHVQLDKLFNNYLRIGSEKQLFLDEVIERDYNPFTWKSKTIRYRTIPPEEHPITGIEALNEKERLLAHSAGELSRRKREAAASEEAALRTKEEIQRKEHARLRRRKSRPSSPNRSFSSQAQMSPRMQLLSSPPGSPLTSPHVLYPSDTLNMTGRSPSPSLLGSFSSPSSSTPLAFDSLPSEKTEFQFVDNDTAIKFQVPMLNLSSRQTKSGSRTSSSSHSSSSSSSSSPSSPFPTSPSPSPSSFPSSSVSFVPFPTKSCPPLSPSLQSNASSSSSCHSFHIPLTPSSLDSSASNSSFFSSFQHSSPSSSSPFLSARNQMSSAQSHHHHNHHHHQNQQQKKQKQKNCQQPYPSHPPSSMMQVLMATERKNDLFSSSSPSSPSSPSPSSFSSSSSSSSSSPFSSSSFSERQSILSTRCRRGQRKPQHPLTARSPSFEASSSPFASSTPSSFSSGSSRSSFRPFTASAVASSSPSSSLKPLSSRHSSFRSASSSNYYSSSSSPSSSRTYSSSSSSSSRYPSSPSSSLPSHSSSCSQSPVYPPHSPAKAASMGKRFPVDPRQWSKIDGGVFDTRQSSIQMKKRDPFTQYKFKTQIVTDELSARSEGSFEQPLFRSSKRIFPNARADKICLA